MLFFEKHQNAYQPIRIKHSRMLCYTIDYLVWIKIQWNIMLVNVKNEVQINIECTNNAHILTAFIIRTLTSLNVEQQEEENALLSKAGVFKQGFRECYGVCGKVQTKTVHIYLYIYSLYNIWCLNKSCIIISKTVSFL